MFTAEPDIFMSTIFKKERASEPPARLQIPLNLRSSTLTVITQ